MVILYGVFMSEKNMERLEGIATAITVLYGASLFSPTVKETFPTWNASTVLVISLILTAALVAGVIMVVEFRRKRELANNSSEIR